MQLWLNRGASNKIFVAVTSEEDTVEILEVELPGRGKGARVLDKVKEDLEIVEKHRRQGIRHLPSTRI